MELTKEVPNTRKPYFLSLLLTGSLGVVTYVMIRFVTFQYFDSFWTNWVLFVSFTTIAFMIWHTIDPLRGDGTRNKWITRAVGIAIFLVLAFVIGF
ncbi:hypothetical protein [Sporosarcina ureae]|uniref:hypothetical protein n=1 Tax=Sporosarcina ureae TaxID=1571 RepID=UPI0026EEAD61|nr:hypothetical protein [Sporosarcina ureae]